ncbi:Nuclear envelope morphology protein 1, partial [Lunasporangiospora selenospora]
YIYLTYLFLAHYLVVVPTTAFQYYILRRIPGTKGLSAAPSSSPFRDEQGRDVDEHGHVLDSAVGEQFLQQYTLDNHRRGSRPQVYEANYTTASTSTLTSTNHSHNQIGVSSSNNNNNNSNSNNSSGGTTMLRRSSRFKSKSDLEEIAQQSAATITASGTLAGTSMALLRKSSADSWTGLSSDPGMGSLASSGVGGGGYGTDSSMAEDAGSGRGHLRLRQRLTGRPSSGLGTPGSGGSGRHGLSKTKTLVLDLDETLIHSTSRGSRPQGYMVEVLVDRHACLYYVYKRPHASEWYKLVIFTASMAEYADPVIDWLDQNRTLFDQRYFRQACQYRNGSYLKDLSIVESDLSSVCLLDNSPLSYSLNKENGIPIDSWINDPDDEALLDLLPFLDALRFTEDVRSVLSLRTV